MFYQDFQQSLNHLVQTEEEKVTQSLLEMQCQRSGPFGTGGLMFAGADPFSPGQGQLSTSMDNNDILSLSNVNSCPLKFPFELELIVRTLEKVALDDNNQIQQRVTNTVRRTSKKNSKKVSKSVTRSRSRSPNRRISQENVRMKQETARIPARLCNMSFNDSFNLFDIDSKGISSSSGESSLNPLNPEFCHDWWGWGESSNNSKASSSSGEKSSHSGDKNKDKESKDSKKDEIVGSKKEIETMKTRSRVDTVSKKSVAGVKRQRPRSALDRHSKKTDSCIEGEDSSVETATDNGNDTGSASGKDENNLSITIVLNDEDDESDDDDGKPGKKPNTHKKGQPHKEQEPAKKGTRRSYKAPNKSSHTPRKSRVSINSQTNPNRIRRRRNAREGQSQSRRR